MKYEDMSDGELSFKVHLVVNKIPKGYATISLFNINNPSDIMPIAVKYGITSVYMVDYWSCHGLNEELGNDEDWHSESENLYRAIAICFLKMKDAEK